MKFCSYRQLFLIYGALHKEEFYYTYFISQCFYKYLWRKKNNKFNEPWHWGVTKLYIINSFFSYMLLINSNQTTLNKLLLLFIKNRNFCI